MVFSGNCTNTEFASRGKIILIAVISSFSLVSRISAHLFACEAFFSHAPVSSKPSHAAEINLIFDASCPACLQRWPWLRPHAAKAPRPPRPRRRPRLPRPRPPRLRKVRRRPRPRRVPRLLRRPRSEPLERRCVSPCAEPPAGSVTANAACSDAWQAPFPPRRRGPRFFVAPLATRSPLRGPSCRPDGELDGDRRVV